MPHSYSAIWVHIIGSTKNREPVLIPSLKQEVCAVIKEIAIKNEIYLDCINGVEGHLHLLVKLRTEQTVANTVKIIKGNSWDHFKDDPERYVTWQDGFAAFSVSADHVGQVRSYIRNQEKHHANKSFNDELKEIKLSIKAKL